jgi:hypothetical protein
MDTRSIREACGSFRSKNGILKKKLDDIGIVVCVHILGMKLIIGLSKGKSGELLLSELNELPLWSIHDVSLSTCRWRPFPRDQGKFVAIRDGTNLTEVFGGRERTPWEERFRHSMSLPFYQAHPDQLERIEDNFDMFYTNLMGNEIR